MLLGCPRSNTREWHRTHRVGLMRQIFHPAKCFCSTALPALCLCAELGWPLSHPHSSAYPLKCRPPGRHHCLVSGPSLKPRFLHVQSGRRMLIVSVARSWSSLTHFLCFAALSPETVAHAGSLGLAGDAGLLAQGTSIRSVSVMVQDWAWASVSFAPTQRMFQQLGVFFPHQTY